MIGCKAPEGTKARGRTALLAVGLLFVAMSLAYNFIIPLHYGPDETRHEAYYRWILDTWRLPTDEAMTGAIVHHPPLYYLMCVPGYALTRPLGEPAGHVMRLVSTLLGLLVIIVTHRLLRRLFPDRPLVAVAGAAGVAFLPHFLLISSVIGNDAAAALWGSLVLYMAVVIVQEGAGLKRGLGAGLVLGLGCLTKASVVALGPLLALALLVGAWRRRDRRFDTDGFVYGLFGLAIAWMASGGWWIVTRFLRFGTLDAEPPYPLWAWPDPRLSARFLRAVDGLFRSAWTQVDWFPPAARHPLYVALAILSLVSLVGLARLVWARHRADGGQPWALAIPLLGALTLYLALLQTAIWGHPGRFEGGRYWLPAVAGYMGLWLPGLAGSSRRYGRLLAASGALLLLMTNVLCYYWLIAYLNPTYGPH
jgi:4-amino-4-deoxy-L-arabinose transferase-like glycosyltransferase